MVIHGCLANEHVYIAGGNVTLTIGETAGRVRGMLAVQLPPEARYRQAPAWDRLSRVSELPPLIHLLSTFLKTVRSWNYSLLFVFFPQLRKESAYDRQH